MTDESSPHGRGQTSGIPGFDAAAFEFTIDAETSAAITAAQADVAARPTRRGRPARPARGQRMARRQQ